MSLWRRCGAKTRTVVLTVVLATMGVAGLVMAARLDGSGPLRWWALLPMFVAAELAAVHFEFRREAHSFSLSEIPVVLALLLASPLELIVCRVVGGRVALHLRSGQRGLKLAFNLALFGAETSLAIGVFRALGGHDVSGPRAWLAATAGVVASALLSSVFVNRVMTWHAADLSFVTVTAVSIYGAIANASVAMIAWRLGATERLALGLVAVVVSLIFITSRAYAALAQRYGGLRMLYGFTRTLSSVSSEGEDEMIDVALGEAANLLRADVGVIVRRAADGSVHVHRKREEQPLETEVLLGACALFDVLADADGPLVVRAGDASALGTAVLRALEVRDAVVVPERDGGRLVGLMAVGDRLGQISTFDDEDARLFETLVNHLRVALRNGELVDQLRTEVDQRMHQALHDALTDLPNRTHFHQQVNAFLGRLSGVAAVLLMDLDRFKEVNDTLGHHSGDDVLREVGARLLAALPAGAVVARLGGDEFAMLLPATDRDAAVAAVAVLQASLRQPLLIQGLALDVGATIGVALAPEHGETASQLLQRADVAMYAAKRSSDGVEIYREALDRHNPRRLTLAGELRTAVERGAIDVHYQPMASIADGRIVAVEALARWFHHEEGFVAPDEFIALAEQTGLIRPLTAHVLGLALEQCNAFAAAGHPISVSVNLSSRSLLDSGLPDLVARLLAEHDVAPDRLTLEITESNVMADVDRCLSVLERLDHLGVDLSVDDFGTGYSSLSYLQRLPVDEVKIDKSFVVTMATDHVHAALVRSIITMGQNLGLRVVAEGVEDAATWQELRRAGCDVAQGYFIAVPQTGADLLGFLERTEPDGLAIARRVS